MGRPRISIRTLMAAVIAIALALGLGLPALEVYSQLRVHDHGYVGLIDGRPHYLWNQSICPSFWPLYLRRIQGWAGEKPDGCGAGTGLLAETCALEHPEIVGELICRGPALMPTPAMVAAFDRLKNP
jgi:hypothetical protein